MVYGRTIDGKELEFEASGALMQASLVMRDRQTDSWWSIMTSDAIGGDLEGAELEELPGAIKATWAEWRREHPDTKVLSIDGAEHVENNPYDSYFASDDTFRDLKIDDHRLPAKEPIYAFHAGGRAFAVAHSSFDGGGLISHRELDGRKLLAYRAEGSSFFASSTLFWVPESADEDGDDPMETARLLHRAFSGEFEQVGGFDTYWYSWVAINEGSVLLE